MGNSQTCYRLSQAELREIDAEAKLRHAYQLVEESQLHERVARDCERAAVHELQRVIEREKRNQHRLISHINKMKNRASKFEKEINSIRERIVTFSSATITHMQPIKEPVQMVETKPLGLQFSQVDQTTSMLTEVCARLEHLGVTDTENNGQASWEGRSQRTCRQPPRWKMAETATPNQNQYCVSHSNVTAGVFIHWR